MFQPSSQTVMILGFKGVIGRKCNNFSLISKKLFLFGPCFSLFLKLSWFWVLRGSLVENATIFLWFRKDCLFSVNVSAFFSNCHDFGFEGVIGRKYINFPRTINFSLISKKLFLFGPCFSLFLKLSWFWVRLIDWLIQICCDGVTKISTTNAIDHNFIAMKSISLSVLMGFDGFLGHRRASPSHWDRHPGMQGKKQESTSIIHAKCRRSV